MSSGMTRAPSKSIVGPVATAARTQRIFSRSSRCAVCLNLAISKSSIPKAFTTRFPLTVSCRIWLRSPSLVWLFSEERRIFFPSFPHVLDLGDTHILRDAFRDVKKDHRQGKNRPHMVDTARKKSVEIDRITVGKCHQWQGRTDHGGVKDVIKSWPEHQRHNTVRQ